MPNSILKKTCLFIVTIGISFCSFANNTDVVSALFQNKSTKFDLADGKTSGQTQSITQLPANALKRNQAATIMSVKKIGGVDNWAGMEYEVLDNQGKKTGCKVEFLIAAYSTSVGLSVNGQPAHACGDTYKELPICYYDDSMCAK